MQQPRRMTVNVLLRVLQSSLTDANMKSTMRFLVTVCLCQAFSANDDELRKITNSLVGVIRRMEEFPESCTSYQDTDVRLL
jgi:hypothetical protein